MVVLDDLEGLGPRAELFGHAVQLIVEHVAEPFGEDEREDEILKLRGFLRPANAARGIPDPGLQRLAVSVYHLPLSRFNTLAQQKQTQCVPPHQDAAAERNVPDMESELWHSLARVPEHCKVSNLKTKARRPIFVPDLYSRRDGNGI